MNRVIRVISTIMILPFVICPVFGYDSGGDIAQPFASHYIESCDARMVIDGGGKIIVAFSIKGEMQMESIGAVSIIIMESSDNSTFTTVASFRAESVSSLMGHNRLSYSSSITYQGDPGKYYKATVTLRVTTSSGETETRYVWTGSKQAT